MEHDMPKGMRVEIALNPGAPDHMSLKWIETDKGWLCYTSLPGFNQFGRVDHYDRITFEATMRLMARIRALSHRIDPKAMKAIIHENARTTGEMVVSDISDETD